MWIVAGILLAIAVVAMILLQRGGGIQFPWIPFYIKGKECGFKFAELNLLRRVAVLTKLKNPTSLFWSEKQLDRCIRGVIVNSRAHGKDSDPKSILFLNKMFEFRKRVEFNLPKYRLGIRSSRNMTPAQLIKITFTGGTAYQSQVVENTRKYLAIAYPTGKVLPPGFTWQNQKINVYFWRQGDAGYFFETKVIGDYMDKKLNVLHLAHSENLVRAQKRNSVRRELDVLAALYPLKTLDSATETIEKTGGYRGRMVDISEDGAAILVGGQAKPGLAVKLQLNLDDQPVVMTGVVKGVSYRQKTNQSILHIQSSTLSTTMRNRILTFVYGIFTDEAPKAAGALKPFAPKPAAPPAASPAAVASSTETP